LTGRCAKLARLNTPAYGLVVADLPMFPMSGFELLHRVRDDRRLRETPFAMRTTQEHAHASTSVRRADVDACLVKPVMPAERCGRPDRAPGSVPSSGMQA
jgi:two-component system, chemotaxis family, chemotaxis protein CheY